jgi:hypothetical protein
VVEGETDVPYAALVSLLRPVLVHRRALPDVQRRALEGALALGAPVGAGALAVHAAALGMLIAASKETPLVCVIDDAHWLDPASAQTLLFAARRLQGARIAMLLALRPTHGRALDLTGIERLALAGLTRDESGLLLRRGVEGALSVAVVDRLRTATAGNPLALLEARARLSAGQRAGRDPLDEPLSVGPVARVCFRSRLERLPAATRTALALVAAAGDEPLHGLECAARVLGVELAGSRSG